LREGTIWRIGDGSKINIHHDNWNLRSGSLEPLGADHVQGVTRVSNLLTINETTWDRDNIEHMFSADDASDIVQIAIGGPTMEDYLMWNHTKNDEFF
jgi:hypothetical protein